MKKIAFIGALCLVQMALGGNLAIAIAYYLFLTILLIYSVIKGNVFRSGIIYLTFILICFLSILINQPPALFQAPLRWGLFAIVLMTTTPILMNPRTWIFRYYIFLYCMYLIVIFTVANMLAYYFGIDWGEHYEEIGVFSGVCGSTNSLGTMAGISLVFLSVLLMNNRYHLKKHLILIRWVIIVLLIISFGVLLLASSRTALGAALISLILILYKNYQNSLSKFIGALLIIIIVSIAAFPYITHLSQGLLWKQNGQVSKIDTNSRNDLWKDRIDEFNSNPILGCGFATTKKINEFSKISGGVIETGSGWGSIIGQTGLLGLITFLLIVIPNWLYFFKLKRYNSFSILLLGLMTFFLIHSWGEGYILTGGTPLCVYFWFTQGLALAYRKRYLRVTSIYILSFNKKK